MVGITLVQLLERLLATGALFIVGQLAVLEAYVLVSTAASVSVAAVVITWVCAPRQEQSRHSQDADQRILQWDSYHRAVFRLPEPTHMVRRFIGLHLYHDSAVTVGLGGAEEGWS